MKDNFFDDLVEGNAIKHITQGSDLWDQIRCGRFTASEFHLLMASGQRELTPEELKARPKSGKGSSVKYAPDYSKFSPAGETYINRKVAETLTGKIQESSYAFPLVYGKDLEAEAVQFFQDLTGLETFEVGFQPFGEHAGGSPDRFVMETEGLEIKCPYTSEKQIQYLMLTDQWDLKRMFPDHYWQVMTNMFFCNKEKWHFGTYDPRFKERKLKMVHIEVKPVAEDFDLIALKLEKAVEEKLKLIKLLTV